MDLSPFDAEELLHLAVDLIARQQGADALACLKRAAELDPAHAGVALFTGVVYMQAGLTEHALRSLRGAVDLDPELHLARFQLGLLLYTEEREAEATEVWKPLDRLGDTHALYLFKAGLEAMSQQDFAACRDFLNRGIAANAESPPLNEAMRAVLARADEEEREAREASDPSDLLARFPLTRPPKDLPLPPMFRTPPTRS